MPPSRPHAPASTAGDLRWSRARSRRWPIRPPRRPRKFQRRFSATEAIGGTIAEIDGISGEIAIAVEQQGAATREIAGNLQQAADRTRDVNKNILSVSRSSEEAGMATTRLLEAANA